MSPSSSLTSLTLAHSSSERIAAAIAHAGTVVAWFLAPLVVYLVLPRSSQWARFQALQSLLWSLFGTVVSLATCGLAIPVFLVWHVMAAIKTVEGHEYEYPLVGDAARRAVYGD
jgi:uncharacterized Tic20 family protein